MLGHLLKLNHYCGILKKLGELLSLIVSINFLFIPILCDLYSLGIRASDIIC